MVSQRVGKSRGAGGWLILAIVLGASGCASSGGGESPGEAEPEAANPRAAGPARCVTVVVQNQSMRGVAVYLVWENSARRRLARLSINDRDTFRLPYRSELLSLQFEADGGRNHTSNGVSPLPGDRIEIVYGAQGPGQLRRVGTARC